MEVERRGLMRGPKGEAVTLSIQRLDMARTAGCHYYSRPYADTSVKDLLQGKLRYVRVSQFQDRTSSDLKKRTFEGLARRANAETVT